MKSALVLAALLVSTAVMAEDKKPTRNPNTSDFSQAYLDQVKTEREKENRVSSEEVSREHAKYMKETAHADHFSRGN